MLHLQVFTFLSSSAILRTRGLEEVEARVGAVGAILQWERCAITMFALDLSSDCRPLFLRVYWYSRARLTSQKQGPHELPRACKEVDLILPEHTKLLTPGTIEVGHPAHVISGTHSTAADHGTPATLRISTWSQDRALSTLRIRFVFTFEEGHVWSARGKLVLDSRSITSESHLSKHTNQPLSFSGSFGC